MGHTVEFTYTVLLSILMTHNLTITYFVAKGFIASQQDDTRQFATKKYLAWMKLYSYESLVLKSFTKNLFFCKGQGTVIRFV